MVTEVVDPEWKLVGFQLHSKSKDFYRGGGGGGGGGGNLPSAAD